MTFPKVKAFLDTIGRNSVKTRKNYSTCLVHFQDYLNQIYPDFSLETIIPALSRNEIDVYNIIDKFIGFELSKSEAKVSPQSINVFLIGIKSYFSYYDIDIIPSKFRRRVKVPKTYREYELPIDVNDIRKILLACNNRRLKSYFLVLASGGMRATEAAAIRLKDIDFSVNPTKVHIRKEYSKTRVSRDIYISDEATRYLQDWIKWKYRIKKYKPKKMDPDDLLFVLAGKTKSTFFDSAYANIIKEFQKILDIAGLNERKEGSKRRKVTLHSFRRFVKTVLSDQTNRDYSEWFLGHFGSSYYTKKEPERREVYAKCMKYLTFLDYSTLESTGKNIEAKMEEKDKEIHKLNLEMNKMREDMGQILSMIRQNPQLAQIKPEALKRKKWSS
jgi:integrase